MTQQRLKVAIIGAGMIANAAHIPAWKALAAECEVVGVYDGQPDRARDTAQRHQIPHAFDTLDRMLVETRPDVVSVCTPNASHHDMTIKALQAGAHVLCDKPVATTYVDAVEMFREAEAAHRVLALAQTARFTNSSLAAKEIVASGKLGDIYYAETTAMRRRGVPTWGQFHMKAASGGGPVYDFGAHALDILIWLMGNPRIVAVSAITSNKLMLQGEDLVTTLGDSGAPLGVYNPRVYDKREFDVEDFAFAFLRLENGAAIGLKVAWAAHIPLEGLGGAFLLGTQAGLRLKPLTLFGSLGRYQADVTPVVPPEPTVPFAGHYGATAHLVRVIRGQEELIVRPDEVLNVIRALEGIYLSAGQGREVRLD
jgi:predicted dehydrogenase